MIMPVLAGAAVALTCTMFLSKSSMLGFPSAIFWALFGGYCYLESTITWDIYFLTAFASLLGMTVFCMLGAYGLREKRDTIADEEMEKGEGDQYIDEEAMDEGFIGETTSRRRRGSHSRARRRSEVV